MDNVIAVSTNTYHGFSLDEALDGISRAGFKYVELTAVEGWTEHVKRSMSSGEIDEVLSKLEKKGLKTIGLSGHCNIVTDDGLRDFLGNIDLAVRLGCKYIITSVGAAHGERELAESDQVLVTALKKIVAVCGEKDIGVALETHGDNFGSGQQLARIVKAVGSNRLGINYDTANAIFYGKVRPERDLEESIEHVTYVHLKDKLGKDDEWNFPAVGKGNLDLRKLFGIMRGHNYSGPISVEIEFTPDGPGSVDNVHEAVRYSYDTIADLIQSA